MAGYLPARRMDIYDIERKIPEYEEGIFGPRSNPRIRARGMALSSRVTRLAKKMKITNPLHMYPVTLNTSIPSTTTYFRELGISIAQGDGTADRYVNTVYMKRLIVQCTIIPGSTQAIPCSVRVFLIRAQSGSTLAGLAITTNTSLSPVNQATGVIEKCYDRMHTVAPSLATQYFPLNIRINKKCRLKQKFSGAAAGTNVGESLFFGIISNIATGTAAPLILSGHLEEWFQP